MEDFFDTKLKQSLPTHEVRDDCEPQPILWQCLTYMFCSYNIWGWFLNLCFSSYSSFCNAHTRADIEGVCGITHFLLSFCGTVGANFLDSMMFLQKYLSSYEILLDFFIKLVSFPNQISKNRNNSCWDLANSNLWLDNKNL